MHAYIYVDGFNLYYRALKDRPSVRWLDLHALAQRLLPNDSIECVKYFTARVSGRLDPDAPRRQTIYLNALKSVSSVKIYFGNFKHRRKRRPLVTPIPKYPRVQEFHDMEEKGSDVNLASHLVFDGCTNAYEVAAIISNDTDLLEPIRLVTAELGKPVGVLSPKDRHKELRNIATFSRQINRDDFKKSQFPDPLTIGQQVIHKPATW